MKIYAEKNGKAVLTMSAGAMSLLESHSFPGNVRELENVVERAVITSQDSSIQEKDIAIQQGMRGAILNEEMAENLEKAAWKPGRTLDDIERNVILEALKYHQGNRTHTARALGISIRTLRNKLADYRALGISV